MPSRSSRMILLLLLGFSSGLPLGLTGSTLQAWMQSEGLNLGAIGVFSLVGLPYTLKFVWAPLLDRYVPPFLGRRRGWLLVIQLALAAAIAAMGFSDPRGHLAATAVFAVLTAFFSASQDIVVDAYRVDLLPEEELGLGSATHITGYRVAMIVCASGSLILSDHISWRAVYLLMAAAMSVGVVAGLLAPEPEGARAPRTFRDAVVLPFVEFFKRRGAIEILLFMILYKLDAVLTVALSTPFMMQLNFTKTDIGLLNKGFGLWATLAGTIAGGALMLRLGLKRSLWVFGLTQALAGLSFFWLSLAGHSYVVLALAITVENACSGMGNSAYTAFMMSQCDRRFSATQYALFTSLMAFTRTVLGSPSGFLAGGLGWPGYYLLCTVASVPAFALLLRYDRWQGRAAEV